MRKLILILTLILSISSFGQSPMSRLIKKKAAAVCSYLLTDYTGAAAAYSLRLLKSDYAGSAIRVRRSSDNTEQDIGFAGTCSGLDTASLKTFVGTGGTDDGFVVTWYDQSGNARDATQATSGNQPKIMDNGVVFRQGTNNMPSINWTGGSQRLSVAAFSFAQPTTHFILGKTNGTNDKHFVDGVTGRQLTGVSGGNLVLYANTVLTHGAISTNFNIYTSLFNGGSSSIAVNAGSATTGNAGTANMSNGFYIGSDTGGGGGITGYMSELIFYASDNTSNGSGIRSNVNTYYGVY